MAEKKTVDASPSGAPEAPANAISSKPPGIHRRILRFLRQNLVVTAICGLVLIHAGLFVVWKLRSGPTPLSNEVLLGEFRFDSEPLPGNSIRHAAFRLHVSLLEGATYRGHELLLRKRAKVQQEIEQLLRQAHGADFEDPALAELKRQLQAMINRTLGERVVQEVIITDLSLERFAVTPALDAPARPDDGQWKAAAPS